LANLPQDGGDAKPRGMMNPRVAWVGIGATDVFNGVEQRGHRAAIDARSVLKEVTIRMIGVWAIEPGRTAGQTPVVQASANRRFVSAV
jgi:hypothetical protein